MTDNKDNFRITSFPNEPRVKHIIRWIVLRPFLAGIVTALLMILFLTFVRGVPAIFALISLVPTFALYSVFYIYFDSYLGLKRLAIEFKGNEIIEDDGKKRYVNSPLWLKEVCILFDGTLAIVPKQMPLRIRWRKIYGLDQNILDNAIERFEKLGINKRFSSRLNEIVATLLESLVFTFVGMCGYIFTTLLGFAPILEVQFAVIGGISVWMIAFVFIGINRGVHLPSSADYFRHR